MTIAPDEPTVEPGRPIEPVDPDDVPEVPVSPSIPEPETEPEPV